MRALGTIWATVVLAASIQVANAGVDTKEFPQSILSELGVTAQACLYLSLEERRTFFGVCASTDDPYRDFMERWETLPSIKMARATSDWHSNKQRTYRGSKSTVYYRRYTVADVPFIVFYDKKEKWVLLTIAVSSSTRCEETDSDPQAASPNLYRVPSDETGIEIPKIVSKVPPNYPWPARAMRYHGRVISQAVVEIDGTVSDVCILEAHPRGLGFEEAAMEAILQWRYEPAILNGEPVAVYFTVRADFELQ